MVDLKSTVVGSLPRLASDLAASISKAVDIQLRYGIEVVSDGEQRASMIGYFADLPGLDSKDGRVFTVDRVKAPRDPSKTFKITDLTEAQGHLRKRGLGETPIKLSLTGPVTLAFTCASQGLKTGVYRDIADESLYMDMAEALRSIACEALRRGALLQIDEPGISAGFLNPSISIKAVNSTLEGIAETRSSLNKLSLHICGDLTRTPRLLSHLSKVNVGTLSLAFAGETEKANRRLPLTEISEAGKLLGVGCTSVKVEDPIQVEAEEKAVSTVRLVASKMGLDKICYIHPDCGLRSTPLPAARRILEVTSKTTKLLRQSQSNPK